MIVALKRRVKSVLRGIITRIVGVDSLALATDLRSLTQEFAISKSRQTALEGDLAKLEDELSIALAKLTVDLYKPLATLTLDHNAMKGQFQESRKARQEKDVVFGESIAGLRVHIENGQKRDTQIAAEIKLIQRLLEEVATNPSAFWLFANRGERMDANLPFYDESRRRFHRARYEFAAAHVSGKDVADIACGTGYGASILDNQGLARTVLGIDIDTNAISYAKTAYGAENVTFLAADGQSTGIRSSSMDVITSFETIEHVPDDAALLAEFERILRPGGILIISTPNQWPLAVAPYHLREYELQSFVAVLSQHFKVEKMFNQNSGTSSPFNRGEPEGIVETCNENEAKAECYIAICSRSN